MRELFEQKLKRFTLPIFDRDESGSLIMRDYLRNIIEDVKRRPAHLGLAGICDTALALAHMWP